MRFETYARVVSAIRYDGTLEGVAAINAFAGADKMHIRYGSAPVFMTEFGLVNLVKGDWIVEIAEGRFVPMKDATRQAVFAPRTGDLNPHDSADAFVHVLRDRVAEVADRLPEWYATSPYTYGDPGQLSQVFGGLADTIENCNREYENQLGLDFAQESGLVAGDPPLPPDSERTVPQFMASGGWNRAVPRFVAPEGLKPDLTPGSIIEAQEGPKDESMIVIREDHPHHKLINSILILTGISDLIKSDNPPVHAAPYIATDLPYEVALIAMKAGYRVDRAAWHGRAWVCMGEGQRCQPRQFWNKHTRAFAEQRWEQRPGTSSGDVNPLSPDYMSEYQTKVEPYMVAKTPDDTIDMAFAPMVNDIFANDWRILEN